MGTPFGWISGDGRIIILSRAIRTFGQGFAVLIIPIYLKELGFGLRDLGWFLTAGIAGAAAFTLIITVAGERMGRTLSLVVLTLFQAAIGPALIFSDNMALLAFFSFLGVFSGAQGAGPVLAIEQAMLASAASPERRTNVFAVYRITSVFCGAIGALAAGAPVLLGRSFGMDNLAGQRTMLWLYGCLLLVVATLYWAISRAPEPGHPPALRRWTNPMTLPSRSRILKLTSLFSVDSFAGALVVQSLVAYWFNDRFGYQLGSLSWIFFVSQILAAFSFWVSTLLATRIGLINTMVFTHIPSNLFLLGVAFSPVGWLAVLFWQMRSLLGQMDVPARDSYTMTIVQPEERVAMAGAHLAGRSLAGIAGPSVSALLWTSISAAAPFVACGVIKIGYDIALLALFKNAPAPKEDCRQQRKRGVEEQQAPP